MKNVFLDGIKSLVSSIANTRSPANNNRIVGDTLDWQQMSEIYRTGLGNKIVRLKAGDALAPESLEFERKEDREWYERNMARDIRKVVKWQLAFGRGILVLQDRGGSLRAPLPSNIDPKRLVIRVFSGDMVTAASPDVNLESERYLLPSEYYVRGVPIHHTRVIDFAYVEPPEYQAPLYQYGGISEFELIYQQLIADGVVERATPAILEKNSTLFYKIKGFKEALQQGKESEILKFYNILEDHRSIHGAGLVDAEDEVVTVEQTLTNLSDADQITLRRIAMVTGLSITRLVGENVRGLNSSGETERESDRATISALQNDYVLPPLQKLMQKLGRGEVKFSRALAETPGEKADYEAKILQNAAMMYDLGEDHEAYLREHGLGERDAWDEVFAQDDPEERDQPEPDMQQTLSALMGDGDGEA